MERNALKKAVALAQNLRQVFIATADRGGLPHVASAGKISLLPEGRVAVSAWFCPCTVANLEENRRLSLVIWDPRADVGYQLLGKTEKVEELAMMNGYIPGEEEKPPLPQVERQLIVGVEKILEFRRAPHSDREKK